jgi:hydrogenase expression/formation protein HypC
MCLAVPGRVLDIASTDAMRTARVDFSGVVRPVCLAYVPEAEVGDYVLVHVGFAISRIDEETARETWAILAEMGALELPEEDSHAPR